jgi:hypothetical protein
MPTIQNKNIQGFYVQKENILMKKKIKRKLNQSNQL